MRTHQTQLRHAAGGLIAASVLAHHEQRRELLTRSILVSAFALWGIASVTQPFCGACTRARLSADGKLYTCLFAARGHDLRDLMRSGASDEELATKIRSIWGDPADRYSELRHAHTEPRPKIEMFYIGG